MGGAIGPDVLRGRDVRGRAVLFRTGWSQHWATDAYFEGHPHLTAATAEALGEPAGGGAVFRVGDDVVHAAFGDGVVTGVEPGGIVVVNFAGEGRERKLMADYAPIRRR